MKKLLLILAVAVMAMGCEGPPGRDGQDGVVRKVTARYSVSPKQWVREVNDDGDFLFFTHTYFVEGLTRRNTDNIACITYKEFKDRDYTYREPLGAPVYNKDGDIEWSETLAVEYYFFDDGVEIVIFNTASDFIEELPDGTMSFYFVAIL